MEKEALKSSAYGLVAEESIQRMSLISFNQYFPTSHC